jgi:hypothetical protein
MAHSALVFVPEILPHTQPGTPDVLADLAHEAAKRLVEALPSIGSVAMVESTLLPTLKDDLPQRRPDSSGGGIEKEIQKDKGDKSPGSGKDGSKSN